MKKFIFAVAIALVSMVLFAGRNNSIDPSQIQEGDIVFIESQSAQAPYIKAGTMSRWTHCGIVVDTPHGLQVLEASKTVRLTPYDKFVGRAKNGNCCVKRPQQGIAGKIDYGKYLGMPYDLQFTFNNGKMYCSELVWLIYRDNGIELCKPRKVSDYIFANIPKVKEVMKKRGITQEQYVVAPSDLYKVL